MLFNSYIFIFLFLPVVFLLFFFTGKLNRHIGILILTIASLIFYSWWNIWNLPILLISILVNYTTGMFLLKFRKSKIPLTIGVIFNLTFLGYYKYFGLLIETISSISHHQISANIPTLPLGISFFTFTQIAFLVDVYKSVAAEYSPLNYTLFVSYFPHLIAGPIIHHKDVIPQFMKNTFQKINLKSLCIGITFFSIGMFKKVIIADHLTQFVDPIFNQFNINYSSWEIWQGVLAYTFELYFDFSGYSDMAVGLSKLFNVDLPINFDSPYRSLSIIEFWRRWNMTLSRFLRDYLYIPLGGNRNGKVRRYINLLLTMLLGGLWHGANYTYLAWGGLHGTYLIIAHFFYKKIRMPRIISWGITFLAVIIGWVFFRAPSFQVAYHILYKMFTLDYSSHNFFVNFTGLSMKANISLVACFFICLFLPNTKQLLSKHYDALEIYTLHDQDVLGITLKIYWRENLVWAALVACMLFTSIMYFNDASPFLYFNF